MSLDFDLRTFDTADGPGLVRLHKRAILAVAPRYYSEAERLSWAEGADVYKYERVAAEGSLTVAVTPVGDILGFCGIRFGDPYGQIWAIYVDPDAQGQGVGQALMANAEALLRDQGHARFTLDASLSSLAFYERCGYQAVARQKRPTAGGLELTAWKMEKLA